MPGPSRFLPCGPALCVLEVPRGRTAIISASDRKDFYHQLRVPATRARTNALWPPLPVKLLQSTKAYDALCDQIQSRKKLSREEKGDDLGGLVLGLPATSSALVPKKLSDDTLVHACFNTVAQGDHLGVEIATDSHRNLLKSKGLLVAEEELVSNLPFGGLLPPRARHRRLLQCVCRGPQLSTWNFSLLQEFLSCCKDLRRCWFDRVACKRCERGAESQGCRSRD